jgi:uncharacterized membrane protein YraQ (UPF0718 family)
MKGGYMPNLNIFLIMSALAVGLGVFAFSKDPSMAVSGLKDGGKTLLSIIPVLIPAFIVGGLLPKVMPQEMMGRWLGAESGIKGLAVGTLAGGFCPGGPFVAFPLVAGLLKAGAGVAPMAAFITAWGSLAFNRVFVFDIPMVGWKFTIARLLATSLLPIAVGLLTKVLYERF